MNIKKTFHLSYFFEVKNGQYWKLSTLSKLKTFDVISTSPFPSPVSHFDGKRSNSVGKCLREKKNPKENHLSEEKVLMTLEMDSECIFNQGFISKTCRLLRSVATSCSFSHPFPILIRVDCSSYNDIAKLT